MGKDPVCPLCSGRLEKHADVKIQAGGADVLSYTRAWVCEDCAAAFPIAVGRGVGIRMARPPDEVREPPE